MNDWRIAWAERPASRSWKKAWCDALHIFTWHWDGFWWFQLLASWSIRAQGIDHLGYVPSPTEIFSWFSYRALNLDFFFFFFCKCANLSGARNYLSTISPWPSCPLVPLPHEKTFLASVRARVCLHPQATWTTFCSWVAYDTNETETENAKLITSTERNPSSDGAVK